MRNRCILLFAFFLFLLPAHSQEVNDTIVQSDNNFLSKNLVDTIAETKADSLPTVQNQLKGCLSSLEFVKPYDASKVYRFRPTKLILPAAMIGLGAWAVNNGFLVKEKGKLQDKIQDWSGGHTTKIDDFLQYVPTAASFILPYVGTKTKLKELDRWIVRVNGYVIMGGLTWGTKKLVNEWRPDGSDDDSFFSGHCAKSFLAAEMIRLEYGGWYGVGAYTVACGVGVLRLYNNRHWLNDVLAGAGVGILSARVAYWLLPIEKKILGLDQSKDTNVCIVPYYSCASGNHFGASVAIGF